MADTFAVLLRARLRMVINTVRATPRWQKITLSCLSVFSLLLFLAISAACMALVRLVQAGNPMRAGLTPAAESLVSRIYEYLLFFLVAGSVPFVASALFQSDDLPLLFSTPARPRAIVAAKVFDAALVNAAQFVVLGIPVLVGLGWAVHLSFLGWVWLLTAALLMLTLAPAASAALLLAAARWLGMRRIRLVVIIVSILLGVGITGLAVVGAGRAAGTGVLSADRLQAAMCGEMPPELDPHRQGLATVHDESSPWLPSAWGTAMLADTAGGHPLRVRGLFGFLGLLGLTVLLVGLCLTIGPGVMTSEAFLECADSGSVIQSHRRSSRRLRSLPPVIAGLMAKDFKYVIRDLILLGQIGTALILFLVPFLLKFVQGTGSGADNDIYGYLALAMLAMIVYMMTSIVSLTSVGLEGRGFWLVLASPVTRGTFLQAKWLGSFALSALISGTLTLAAWLLFGWSLPLGAGALVIFVCACGALSGLGVGLAGLFPRFIYENPAHRASVWALILSFVFATGYMIICGLIACAAIVVVVKNAASVTAAIGVASITFLAVSALTGLIPVLLAERRLRDYEWE